MGRHLGYPVGRERPYLEMFIVDAEESAGVLKRGGTRILLLRFSQL